MPERKLSREQKLQIENIKAEWMTEIEKIPELPLSERKLILDGGGGPYRDLELKYKKKIRDVIEASE